MPPQTFSSEDAYEALASTRQPPDFYQVLGLDPKASAQDVRKSFLQLALKYHPDKQQPSFRDEAATKFQLVRRAYDVLSNPQKRLFYDTKKSLQCDAPAPTYEGRVPRAAPAHESTHRQPSAAWTQDEKNLFFRAIANGGVDYVAINKALPSKSLSDVRQFYFHCVRGGHQLLATMDPSSELHAKLSASIPDLLLHFWNMQQAAAAAQAQPVAPTPVPTPAPPSPVARAPSPIPPPPSPRPLEAELPSFAPPARPKPKRKGPTAEERKVAAEMVRNAKLRRVAEARARMDERRRALGLKVKRLKTKTGGAPGRPRKVPASKAPIPAL